MPVRLRPVEIDLCLRDCRARLPFRFGITTLTAAPLLLLRVVVETQDGRRGEGFASDLLVPKWFTKNPDTSVVQDWRELIDGVEGACAIALDGREHASVFEHWRRTYAIRVESAPQGMVAGLLRNHGVSLVERALIDANCRLSEAALHQALREDLLGFRPGEVDAALGAWDARSHFARPPLERVTLRHTVGLVDRLREQDIAPDERVNDGLPESLESDIERYGLMHFKVKIVGDAEAVRERLGAIARVVRPRVGDGARFSLDGNEQFLSMGGLAESLGAAGNDADVAWLLERVMWIEQPLSRACSFDAPACAGMERLPAPCIIDEADGTIDSLRRAADVGYRGISIKNCKGVFKALINAGRCALSNGKLFQTGEDLTNLPVVALQQDLATMATIGISSIERNGHHYFAGMRHLPSTDSQAAEQRHGDLYNQGLLRVRQGAISTASIVQARGFGYHGPVDLAEWTPIEQWSPGALLTGNP